MSLNEAIANAVAQDAIESCRVMGDAGTFLDLRGLGLTHVPPAIGLLSALQVLHLEKNELMALPPEIACLSALKELHLDNNKLVFLPFEIGYLSALEELHLDSNSLLYLPPEIGRLSALQSLHLGDNDLVTLPPEIGQLSKLLGLYLERNVISSLPREIGELSALVELHLDYNKLTTLPPEIGQISSLETLCLEGNELVALPKEIGQITGLLTLGLDSNHLKELPREIWELSALAELDLSCNQLASLPPEIGKLSDLVDLCISGNRLVHLPREIGNLSKLSTLYLSGNQLASLPPEIVKLSSLKVLHIDNNELSKLPPEIGQISSLIELSVEDNELIALPTEITQLTSLVDLVLDRNLLESLPDEIGQLASLTRFYVGGNRIANLPPGIGKLSSLKELHLDDNVLASLPQEIGELSQLEILILERNALRTLPEVLNRLANLRVLTLHWNAALALPEDVLGTSWMELTMEPPGGTLAKPQVILDYYFRSQIAGGPLNEVKVILVGRGGAGKTSLVKRLVRNEFDEHEKETPGISITDWTLPCGKDEVKLHLWDFAGQEITHGTHQFFFSERSIYLLLLTGREGNAERDADYWLRLIRAFGSQSPVLVVLNKIEQCPFELDEPAIQRDHPSVRSFHRVDCKSKSGKGRTELLKALKQTIQGMESVHKTFPAEWMRVKNRLSGMRENYLDQTQYRAICAENGEENAAAQDALAGHLHHLGIALNYADDARVRHALVLNPGWVTDGIYKIIRGVEKAKPPGELKASALARLLPEEKNAAMRRYLVNLMRKFELCFAIDEEEKRFLVPAVLPVKSPNLGAEWTKDKEALRLRYEYDALPQGLLPRFLVRTHVLSQGKPRWRTGVMLGFEGAEALVRAVQGKQDYIEIIIRGEHQSVQRLAGVVRENFRVIHEDIKALDPRLMIEVAGGSGVYQRLAFLEDEAKKDGPLRVDSGTEALVVVEKEVLDKVQPPEMLGAPAPVLRVFVSYSRKDLALKEQFDVNLKVLANQKKIIPWSDNRLAGGEDWNAEIESALKAADIILFLVTGNFLASDYVRDNEMPWAMKRAAAKEAIVIPVILKDCGWQDEEWQKFGALPDPKRPVAEWDDVEKGFYEVEKGVREVIKRILADPRRKVFRGHVPGSFG